MLFLYGDAPLNESKRPANFASLRDSSCNNIQRLTSLREKVRRKEKSKEERNEIDGEKRYGTRARLSIGSFSVYVNYKGRRDIERRNASRDSSSFKYKKKVKAK